MFKQQHIQLAISCITGVEIKKDQIVNTMLGTECPVSLAFEGDKVIVVHNGNVVFFTTTPQYSAEVHNFLQKQKLVRSLRKEVKDIEKQLKAYSTTYLPDGEVLTSSLEEPKVPGVMKNSDDSLDLGFVKEGDTVVLRRGTELTVALVTHSPGEKLPYCINYTDNSEIHYKYNGAYSSNGYENQLDIVKVIRN